MRKLIAGMVCFGLSAMIAVAGGVGGFEGNWIATGGIVEGKKLPADEIEKAMLVVSFKDGKYTVTSMGKQLEAGTYTVDAKAKPHASIDLKITEGKDKDKTQVGIYKVDGDQVTFAISSAGVKERPKTFEGGKDVEVTMFKRSK